VEGAERWHWVRRARHGTAGEVGGPCAATKKRQKERTRASGRRTCEKGEREKECASESENERREHSEEEAREAREGERTRVLERERGRERVHARGARGAREARERERTRMKERERERVHERERERTSKRGTEKKEERENGTGTTTTAMQASWAWTGAPARHRRPGEDRRCGCTCSTVVRRGTARGSSCQHRHCSPTYRTDGWRREVGCGSSRTRLYP